MRYALINELDIVVNIIEYNGLTPYEPAEGLRLVPVNEWIEIGNPITKSFEDSVASG